jgi:hypothetical protein
MSFHRLSLVKIYIYGYLESIVDNTK